MYTGFFGLSEIPFSIAPNPHYLFMSERHREALAHLTYGLGETGGFVLLTGEVGTGKTTVSRCLLSQLPENTQAAFILNPTLSSQELLATLCDELKIRYRKTGATLKTLTDKIQQKLIKNHEAGLNTVLIIDEAQHLKAEALEQLRLLTNLETNTKKLLQVILIGQPELQHLLQRQDLRQLAQRITARYHLLPLNKHEVAQYIQHRLAVAHCEKPLFTKQAITTIHKISKGIPRLINLLCDRALLGAYGAQKNVVSAKIIKHAALEALGSEYQLKSWWQHKISKIVLALILLISVLFLGFYIGGQATQNQRVENNSLSPTIAKSFELSIFAEENRALAPAVQHLFSLWRITINEPLEQPCNVAEQYALSCYWYRGNISQLLRLNYPAVLKLFDQQGQPFYATLIATNQKNINATFTTTKPDEQTIRLRLLDKNSSKTVTLKESQLDAYWRGGALIFWQAPKLKNKQHFEQLDDESTPEQWQWLETKLSEKQQRPARTVDSFDATLKNQLAQYQRQHGLTVSSNHLVDKITLMQLSNQVAEGLPIFNQQINE